jgi:hypothetical protein
VKNGTKTSHFEAPVPTEVPCFHNHLAGAQKTSGYLGDISAAFG